MKLSYKLVFQCGERWVVCYTYNEFYSSKEEAEYAYQKLDAPTIKEFIKLDNTPPPP